MKDFLRTHQNSSTTLYFWLLWGAPLVVLILSAYIRIGLLDVPLQRDEGEYAYAGQLLLQGYLPYQYLYNMKLPGIYAAYAEILALFGQSHTGIHAGLLTINLATTFLIFLFAKRLLDPVSGVAAMATFAILSIGQPVQGVSANAEHFVLLPAMGGLFILIRFRNEKCLLCYFFSGLLLGIAVLMKQHGIMFLVCGGVFILFKELIQESRNLWMMAKQTTLFTLGAVLPYGMICLFFLWSGIFDKFWFWTFKYALTYASNKPFSEAWPMFKRKFLDIVSFAPILWIIVSCGFPALIWNKRLRSSMPFIFLFVVSSLLAIMPGFNFRWHYFILILPAVAFLVGITISTVETILYRFINSKKLSSCITIILFAACIAVTLYQQRGFLFQMSPIEASRAMYPTNLFPESLEIGNYLKNNTAEDDRIAVIGSEPQIYFYSGRKAATGYIYVYALMEEHEFAEEMQKEMIKEIESARPEILVFVNDESSWLRRPKSPTLIFKWINQYVRYYRIVGTVEIKKGTAFYHWNSLAKWPPLTRKWICVMRRLHPQ